jgi:hypothetical protein
LVAEQRKGARHLALMTGATRGASHWRLLRRDLLGDISANDQYTPTIDDNLTKGKVVINNVVGTQPETQGVTLSWYAIRPHF